MPRSTSLWVFLALLSAPPVLAETGPMARFMGGHGKMECALVTDVSGVAPPRAACVDGDPACDADGRADGTCRFAVRMCVEIAGTRCGVDPVVHVALRTAPVALAPLDAALHGMAMPAARESCTATVEVPVTTRGRRAGTVAIRATAGMASGRGDLDRIVLRCRPAPPAPTFAAVQEVFARSCASFSCHGAAAAGGLDLTPDAAAATLVAVAPANQAARTAGLLRVAPGDPARSFLLRKLVGELGPGEGEAMPRVGTSLPAARVDLVRRWILAGAPVP